jgi:hypothetical protein
MSRIWSIPLFFFLSVLLLVVVGSGVTVNSFAGKIAVSAHSANSNDLNHPCYWNRLPFGVDDWITSSPNSASLATFSYETWTYEALVATRYGQGNVVYASGSVFSEIDNVVAPHNVNHEVFLNSVKWVTNGQVPTQTTILVTYGHRELVTYTEWGHACCDSNIVLALENAGYTVEITSDIPITLTGYGAVIMPGVGWYGTPQYSDPVYWSGDTGHAPTPVEVAALLNFVQNGGGLIASVEFNQGADWMNPIGMPMSVTFGSISNNGTIHQASRVADHFVLAKQCISTYLPSVNR